MAAEVSSPVGPETGSYSRQSPCEASNPEAGCGEHLPPGSVAVYKGGERLGGRMRLSPSRQELTTWPKQKRGGEVCCVRKFCLILCQV